MKKDIILALGGGGARGLAHIGVIRALEDAGYRIVGVAGTSIGSVVGGLHCAGVLDEYVDFLDNLDRKGILMLVDLRFPIRGLVGGRRIEALIRRLAGGHSIETLPLPFTSVATELSNGIEVRLREGDLAQAIRASFAIPGFFSPVLINSQWLVDGGVSTPVPAAAAAALGSAPVVAINVNSAELPPVQKAFEAIHPPTPEPEGPPNILSAMSDAIAHLQYKLGVYQLQDHKPAFILEPQLRGVGLFDFHRATDLIRAGGRAAKYVLDSGEFELALQEAHVRRLDLEATSGRRSRPGDWLRGRR